MDSELSVSDLEGALPSGSPPKLPKLMSPVLSERTMSLPPFPPDDGAAPVSPMARQSSTTQPAPLPTSRVGAQHCSRL